MRQMTPATFAVFPISGSEPHITSATALKGIVSLYEQLVLYALFHINSVCHNKTIKN